MVRAVLVAFLAVAGSCCLGAKLPTIPGIPGAGRQLFNDPQPQLLQPLSNVENLLGSYLPPVPEPCLPVTSTRVVPRTSTIYRDIGSTRVSTVFVTRTNTRTERVFTTSFSNLVTTVTRPSVVRSTIFNTRTVTTTRTGVTTLQGGTTTVTQTNVQTSTQVQTITTTRVVTEGRTVTRTQVSSRVVPSTFTRVDRRTNTVTVTRTEPAITSTFTQVVDRTNIITSTRPGPTRTITATQVITNVVTRTTNLPAVTSTIVSTMMNTVRSTVLTTLVNTRVVTRDVTQFVTRTTQRRVTEGSTTTVFRTEVVPTTVVDVRFTTQVVPSFVTRETVVTRTATRGGQDSTVIVTRSQISTITRGGQTRTSQVVSTVFRTNVVTSTVISDRPVVITQTTTIPCTGGGGYKYDEPETAFTFGG